MMAVMVMAAIVSIIEGNEPLFEGAQMGFWGGLVGGLVSLAGGIASGVLGNQQAAKAREELDKSQAMMDRWYKDEMSANILDRADTLSMLKRYREAQEEQSRKYANNAIKGGASEEARVAYAQAANKGYADAVSQIAAQGQAHKDQVTQAWMQGKQAYHNNLAQLYQGAGQNIANVTSSAFNSLANIIG